MKRMNRMYKTVLALSLAILPSAAMALDPVLGGSKTTEDKVISSSSQWTSLHGTYATIPNGQVYKCAVTCTSTVEVPIDSDSSNEYYYGASNLIGPNLGMLDACVREFSTPLKSNPVGTTIKKMSIASTCHVPSVSGTQPFFCQGRKASSGTLNLTVEDTSMHVVCTDY